MPTWIAVTFRKSGIGNWREEDGRRNAGSKVLRARSLALIPHSQFLVPHAGFTLLELSLALFIVGLLTVVFLPQFGDFGQARLEASARRIAALARYLSGQAAFTGRVYRLNYDLDDGNYSVSILTATSEKAEFVPDQSPLTRSVGLPTAITFADVRVPNVGRVSTGQAFTHFYPQGYVDPTVIHLRDTNARVMTVTIPPLTGEARVHEGYVDAMVQR